MSQKEPNKNQQAIALGLALGSQFIGAILTGYFLGKWVDNKWDAAPWGTMVSVGVCFAGVLLNCIRVYMKQMDDDSKK